MTARPRRPPSVPSRRPKVVAVVLAAGSSSRMGRPKPLVELEGQPLLERVLTVLGTSRVDSRVVVLGASADQVRGRIALGSTTVVENPSPERGLSSSLRVGVRAVPRGTTHVLVVLGDQPFVSAASVDALIQRAGSGDGRIFIPTYRGIRGNPVLFDATLAPETATIEGDVGCRAMFPNHPHEIREVPVDDPGILVDLDTPGDLASYEEVIARGGTREDAVRLLAGPRLTLHASPAEHPEPRRIWRPPDVEALVQRLRREHQPFALATVVRALRPTSGRPGYKAVIRPDGTYVGWVGGNCTEHLLVTEARAALSAGEPRLLRVSPGGGSRSEEGIVDRTMVCESGGTVEIYIEPNLPKPELIVVGDSPVATSLAALAPVLGYRVVLVAPGARSKDLPEVAELVERVEDLPARLSPSSLVVVASMGRYDETSLALIARAPVAFVGLVASRTRAKAVFAGLRESGLTAEEIGVIRNPVGLDLGAETPEEIALSILAELTQIRRHPPPAAAPSPPAGTEAPAIDPVCDMEVERTSPIHAEHAGTTYYFCSEGCRRKFVRSPAKFLA